MRSVEELERILRRIDGRGYKAYKEIGGAWRFEGFTLRVDHVQGDPFAAPSRVRVLLDSEEAGLPPDSVRTQARATGTAAFLARAFGRGAGRAGSHRGSGKSGEIRIEAPGQEVLPQTAVLVGGNGSVEARFTVGLPARGRRVLGRQAIALLTEDVPTLVASALHGPAHDPAEIEAHAAANEDADHLRRLLPEHGLVAFVADGARLPRRSGIDDRPLEGEVVPFRSPEALRVTLEAPNAGPVPGMGVRPGITLVVGGGFHGKSTLLRAIETGVYNHRPGDGRERVVTVPEAVKIRAEDGRAVAGVDISPFIDGLPFGRDTRVFSTPNASGSTSQAAAVVEALEAGAGLLLLDEDTSATNFMIRDRRMQALVPKEGEPITPFVDRARELYASLGVSTVLVIGGSGDYLDVADTVLAMRDYEVAEVTERARDVAAGHPTGREAEAPAPLSPPRPRVPARGSLDPARGRRPVHVRVPDDRTLHFGRETVDLVAVEQIVALGQIRAIGRGLAVAASELVDGARSVPEILEAIEARLEAEGLDALDGRAMGDMTDFRRFELAAALNRLRALRVVRPDPPADPGRRTRSDGGSA